MKHNSVVTNIQQDFSKAEQALGRKNINAAGELGWTEICRRMNDTTSSDNWAKVCDLNLEGIASNKQYTFETSIKFICTNSGTDGQITESGTFDFNFEYIPPLNVLYDQGSWISYDSKLAGTENQQVKGIKVVKVRDSNNWGVCKKLEIWVNLSTRFTYSSVLSVKALINNGTECSRTTYSTPSIYELPFTYNCGIAYTSHTEPIYTDTDETVYTYSSYPVKVRTVAVYPQTFDNSEKVQARTNIDASKVGYVNALGGTPLTELGDLYVVTYQSGKTLNDGTGDLGYLVPEPPSGTVGYVLSNGRNNLEWKSLEEIPKGEIWRLMNSSNDSACTGIISQYKISEPEEANAVWGTVTFESSTSGKYSLVPCNADGYLSKYASQCVNIGVVPTYEPQTYNFLFQSDGTNDITHIGIKGNQAQVQDCNMKYLAVQIKK